MKVSLCCTKLVVITSRLTRKASSDSLGDAQHWPRNADIGFQVLLTPAGLLILCPSHEAAEDIVAPRVRQYNSLYVTPTSCQLHMTHISHLPYKACRKLECGADLSFHCASHVGFIIHKPLQLFINKFALSQGLTGIIQRRKRMIQIEIET